MPKLKTKSSCKGRFKISGTGKVLFKNTGKSHGMTKRSGQQIRDKRKQDIVADGERKFMLKKFMSYFRKLKKIL